MAVDTAQGVISHVQADFADGRDSQSLPDITLKLQQRLATNELRLEEILADSGYSNGSNYALLEQWNIIDGPPLISSFSVDLIQKSTILMNGLTKAASSLGSAANTSLTIFNRWLFWLPCLFPVTPTVPLGISKRKHYDLA